MAGGTGGGGDGAYDVGDNEDDTIYIGSNHIDNYAMEAVQALSKKDSVTLRSKGRSIPTAVTVANIVTREVLKKRSRVRQILLDTDAAPGIGSMTSTIEIHIDRLQSS
ncbi:MAG: ribonuclease P subunit p25 family protein [Nitrosopumilaceae archaeon]|nr:ribonuclease P subunit p25 family protein [Nitrosopumilaceae archaeon]